MFELGATSKVKATEYADGLYMRKGKKRKRKEGGERRRRGEVEKRRRQRKMILDFGLSH